MYTNRHICATVPLNGRNLISITVQYTANEQKTLFDEVSGLFKVMLCGVKGAEEVRKKFGIALDRALKLDPNS